MMRSKSVQASGAVVVGRVRSWRLLISTGVLVITWAICELAYNGGTGLLRKVFLWPCGLHAVGHEYGTLTRLAPFLWMGFLLPLLTCVTILGFKYLHRHGSPVSAVTSASAPYGSPRKRRKKKGTPSVRPGGGWDGARRPAGRHISADSEEARQSHAETSTPGFLEALGHLLQMPTTPGERLAVTSWRAGCSGDESDSLGDDSPVDDSGTDYGHRRDCSASNVASIAATDATRQQTPYPKSARDQMKRSNLDGPGEPPLVSPAGKEQKEETRCFSRSRSLGMPEKPLPTPTVSPSQQEPTSILLPFKVLASEARASLLEALGENEVAAESQDAGAAEIKRVSTPLEHEPLNTRAATSSSTSSVSSSFPHSTDSLVSAASLPAPVVGPIGSLSTPDHFQEETSGIIASNPRLSVPPFPPRVWSRKRQLESKQVWDTEDSLFHRLFNMSLGDLIRFFNHKRDHTRRVLTSFFTELEARAMTLSPPVAADLIRLPVKLQTPNASVTRALCARLLSVPPSKRHLTSTQVALAAWSIARSDASLSRNEAVAVLSSLAEEALLILDQFQPLSIANLLWACGKLHYRNDALLASITLVARAQLEAFNAQNIANTYWSLANLDYKTSPLTPSGHVDAEARHIEEVLLKKLVTFNSQALANFIWAAAKLRWCHARILAFAAQRAADNLESCKAQEIANMMWGLAKLGFQEAIPVVKLFAKHVSQDLVAFNAQEVANAYWAIGTLEIRDSPLTPLAWREPIPPTASSCNSTAPSLTSLNDEEADGCLSSGDRRGVLQHSLSSLSTGLGTGDDETGSSSLTVSGSASPSWAQSTVPSLQTLRWRPPIEADGDRGGASLYFDKGAPTRQSTRTCCSGGVPGYTSTTAAPKSSMDPLLQLLLLRMEQFNAQAIANFFWACGKLQWRCAEVCQAASHLIRRNAPHFRPQNTANTLWAMAKLRLRDEDLIDLLTRHAASTLDAFNTQELANVYWALGTLEARHSPLTGGPRWSERQGESEGGSGTAVTCRSSNTPLLAPDHRSPPQYDGSRKCSSGSKPSVYCTEAVLAVVARKLPEFRPQELSNFVWGCARLRWRPVVLLEEAVRTASRLVGRFKPQEVGNLVWALGKLNFCAKSLLEALCQTASRNLDDFTAQNVANIYWGLGVLGVASTRLTDPHPPGRLVTALVELIRKFNDQEIANFVCACGRLGWGGSIPALMDAVQESLMEHVDQLKKRDIMYIQASLRALHRHDIATQLGDTARAGSCGLCTQPPAYGNASGVVIQ